MPDVFTTITNAGKFISTDSYANQYLSGLIKHSIQAKKTIFSNEAFHQEYEYLRQLAFTVEVSPVAFRLDYQNIAVCYVLATIAVEIMDEPIPCDPVTALSFVSRFAEEIRKPEARTFWYEDLESQFEAYVLIYLNQIYGVEISEFVHSITEEMEMNISDLRSARLSYQHAFPYLIDSVEQSFDSVVKLLAKDETKAYGWEALSNVGRINPEKAIALLQYSEAVGAEQYDKFLPNLLHGLYTQGPCLYLDKAIALFNKSPTQSLMALTWFNYMDESQIVKAFEFLLQQEVREVNFLRECPTFYIRLISNPYTSASIRQQCFQLIGLFTKYEDEQLRNNLVRRTGMIKGYDQEKYDLLPSFMAWGQPYFLSDYFNHFNSPHYLFSLVRETFLQYGMRVNMLLFKEALNRQFCRNPQEFSVGLLRMLSDDYAIIRYAGVQVLMSRHTGVYDINFLELDEEHQLRIIKTLLCSPHNIEDLMPLILVLRHSPYQEVARKLESGLIELIQAYGYHLIKLTQQHLSSESTADEALILVLNQAYAKHKEQQDAKKQVKELNPIENELEYLEFFYELEQEKKVESMARAQSKSVFNELVSTVHIIRGSAFASESNPTISPLGKIEISRLVDQRYNINPEMYEWQFRLDATTSNYKDSEEQ